MRSRSRRPIVIPAVLSDKLGDYSFLANLCSTFSHKLHIDIMDGKYVPTKSPDVTEILNSIKDIDSDLAIHLMVENPEMYLDQLVNYHQVKLVYLHIEVVTPEIFTKIYPFEIGLAINPEINLDNYKDCYSKVNVVQIMTIHPGKQSNKFLPESLEQIDNLSNLGYKGEIHIDGSINKITLPTILEFRPNVLNVGSAIVKSKDPRSAYLELTEMCSQTTNMNFFKRLFFRS